MRSLTVYLLSTILFVTNSRGQCHINDFSTACSGSTVGWICPTFTPECGGWWFRSHGTPEMKFYDDQSPYKPDDFWYGYMWAAQNLGEGIYTHVPPLVPNASYQVQLKINTDNWNGSLMVYVANNVPTVYTSVCGGPVPNVPQKQYVGQYNGPTSGWQIINFSFTPNAAYNQVWIYPVASGAQYNVGVRRIQICNMNGLVSTGRVGGGNKDFENSYAPLHITNELDVLPVTKAGPLQVYPTVTSGRINISGDYKDLENGDLTVYDLSGRQVLRQSNAIKSKLTTIELGQLNNGIYLVEIRNARKQFTQKIIISH